MLRNLAISASEQEKKTIQTTQSPSTLPVIEEGAHKDRKESVFMSRKLSPRASVSQPRPSIASSKGPSFVGLLASKRLARQLTNRFFRRRHGSMFGSSRMSQTNQTVQKEPSYRMEPYRKFDEKKVKECIASVLEQKLGNFHYNPKFCANMTKILSDDIKGKVKAMNFDRYKIICSIVIGQQADQGIHVSSQCAWDDKLDNFASYTFRNKKIFCTAMVFGVYNE